MQIMRPTILMLEHDEDDRYITQAVFDENQYQVSLQFVTSQDDFWKHLTTNGARATAPSLILLNYHAGPVTAVEILKELKASEQYRHIPVVVLSGTVKPDIIKDCYRQGLARLFKNPPPPKRPVTRFPILSGIGLKRWN